MIPRRLTNRLALAAGIGVLISSAAAAPFAGARQSAADKIEQASLKLRLLTVGGSVPAPPAPERKKTYDEIVSLLRPLQGKGLPSQRAAVGLLLAESYSGLATLQREKAADLERRSADRETLLAAKYDRWVSSQALAASLEAFDPGPTIKKLQAERAEKADQINDAAGRKDKLETELADLRKQIDAATQQAQQEWAQESRIRQQLADKSQVERLDLIKQANEHKRAGDAHDRKASDLKAQLTRRSPEVRDIQAEIDRLTGQSDQLSQAISDLQQQTALRHQQAEEVRKEGAEVADQIKADAADLIKFREPIAGVWDDAEGQYSQAIDQARGAERGGDPETRRNAVTLRGATSHLLADALTRQARGLGDFARTLNLLASDQPRLPGAADFAGAAAEATKQEQATLEKARKAYADAMDAYGQAGGAGEIGQKLDQLKEQMRALAGDMAPPAPAAPESSAQPATQSQWPQAETDLRRMLAGAVEAIKSGDFKTIQGLVETESPEDKPIVDRVFGLLAAAKDLNQACKDKFGSSLLDSAGAGQAGGAGLGAMVPPTFNTTQMRGELASLKPEDFDVQMVSATEAKVSLSPAVASKIGPAASMPGAGAMPGGSQTPAAGGEGRSGGSVTAKVVGGRWAFVVPSFPPDAKSKVGPIADALAPIVDDLTKTTEEVKSGQFSKIEDMTKVLSMRLEPHIQALMAQFLGAAPMGTQPGGGG